MRATRLFLCVLVLALGSGCTTEHPLKTKFAFLEGDWVSPMGEDTKFYESWRWEGKEWTGTGITVEQGDTLIREEISIFSAYGAIFYGANTGTEEGRIDFELQHDTLGIFIFRNPEHDFPNEIGYESVNSDSIRAWIGGREGEIFDWAFNRR